MIEDEGFNNNNKKKKKIKNAQDESKDSTVIKLNRVSVVPSPLCGTLAPPDDIAALVWHTLVTM